MDTQGFVAGPLSVLCIIALVMGTASAAVMTAADRTASTNTGPVHQHPSPESIIKSLEERGVDVTEVKTALENGDTEAVKSWLETHRPERPHGAGHAPPDMNDPTKQQEIITRLENEGVDVTDVKTSLENGDTEAVQAWLEAYFQAHRPAGPDGSNRSPPDLTESAMQQEIITRLENEGVDVTDVKTSLENGDTDAVQVWLEAYFQAHRPTRQAPGLNDPVREQKIIDRLEDQGVDVTEVEAELQSGNTTAVQTWLENYLPSHEGEMAFHRPSCESPGESRTNTGE